MASWGIDIRIRLSVPLYALQNSGPGSMSYGLCPISIPIVVSSRSILKARGRDEHPCVFSMEKRYIGSGISIEGETQGSGSPINLRMSMRVATDDNDACTFPSRRWTQRATLTSEESHNDVPQELTIVSYREWYCRYCSVSPESH